MTATEPLRLHLKCEYFGLLPEERVQIDEGLEGLRRLLEDFPIADLHLHIIFHPRRKNFHVKADLRLPKRDLFTGERHVLMYPAVESCLRKLAKKVKQLKNQIRGHPQNGKFSHGTLPIVSSTLEPDRAQLEQAARERDYPAFRAAIAYFDEALHKRAGRMVQRHPELEQTLNSRWVLTEFVEGAYLQAFEQFEQRPPQRLGAWLETLLEQSFQLILRRPDQEKEELGAALALLTPDLLRNGRDEGTAK